MANASGGSFSIVVAVGLLAACGDDEAAGGGGSGGGNDGGGGGLQASCCGCLCADPTWSCSEDTCVTEDGLAVELAPEAGFFELAGADFVSYDGPSASPRARVWYSFQPAEEDPGSKPLLMLFNGPSGPALGVLAFNTGHFTFDPVYTGGADLAQNPYRWTDFANLLIIDEPGAGFSYHLPREDGSTPPVTFDAYGEAADYLRIIFRFVARHPQLAGVPIGIVGESGGGIRGSYMHKIMLDYPTLVDGGPYQDEGLYEEILEFLGARRSDIDPAEWTPADITDVFTHQVFINPMVTTYQWEYLTTLEASDVEGCEPPEVADVLDCSETEAEALAVFDHVVSVVTDPALIGQVLRVDMATIEWMHADARQGAYERSEFQDGEPVDDSKFVEVFGELEPQDIYYTFNPDDIHSSWDLGPTFIGLEENEEHGRVALRVLRDVPTLITNGRYDLRFNAQFIAPSLANYTDTLTSAVWNATEPAGAERPGQIELEYLDGTVLVIPLPAYDAGHSVSHHAPAELQEDVRAFIGGGI